MYTELQEVSGIKVVKMTGHILASTQDKFKEFLNKLIEENPGQTLVLSLDGIRNINAQLLEIITDVSQKFKKTKGSIALCNLMPDIEEVCRIAKFRKLVKIFNSESQAIRQLSSNLTLQ